MTIELGSDDVAECGHDIPECYLGVVDGAGFYTTGPADDERNADAALVGLALESTQLAVASKEGWVGAALFVRTVVATEDEDGVVGESFLFKLCHNLTDISVETSNHAGKLSMDVGYGVVAAALLAAEGFVVAELCLIGVEYGVFGLYQFSVGQGVSEQSVERLTAVLTVDPLHRFAVDDVGRILGAIEIIGAVHSVLHILLHHLAHSGRVAQSTTIAIEEIGVVEMCLELADIAVELIDAALVGSGDGAFVAAGPFAKLTGGVAVGFHNLR